MSRNKNLEFALSLVLIAFLILLAHVFVQGQTVATESRHVFRNGDGEIMGVYDPVTEKFDGKEKYFSYCMKMIFDLLRDSKAYTQQLEQQTQYMKEILQQRCPDLFVVPASTQAAVTESSGPVKGAGK